MAAKCHRRSLSRGASEPAVPKHRHPVKTALVQRVRQVPEGMGLLALGFVDALVRAIFPA